MSYYKFEDENALKVDAEIKAERSSLKDRAKELCDYFGGKAIFSNSLTSCDFHGIVFDSFYDVENNHLWTKPAKSNGFSSRPISKHKLVKDKAALQAIKDKFTEANLKRVDTVRLYEALGCDWGTFAFSGLKIASSETAIYIQTGAKLTTGVEILGSEFDAALESIKNSNKKGK